MPSRMDHASRHFSPPAIRQRAALLYNALPCQDVLPQQVPKQHGLKPWTMSQNNPLLISLDFYVYGSAGTPKGQKRVLDSLELELEVVVNHHLCVISC